ncbi:MAG: anaerobic ribonucleoside-triphosphate reductase activating protein [Sedimenticolaceae bacterium]
MNELQVGGITPLTTIDFPGELAAVVFCQGCPWKCRYCQNTHLLPRSLHGAIPWQDVLDLLERRSGLLDAVVFSGGEPTLQRGLPVAAAEARSMGFKIGLHTAGCYPERLDELLPAVDWVGLDIKALPEDYPALTGVTGSGERALDSLDFLVESGVEHEVRVTVHDALLPNDRLRQLLNLLADHGARNVMLQRCRTDHLLDPSLGDNEQAWAYPARYPAAEWTCAVDSAGEA